MLLSGKEESRLEKQTCVTGRDCVGLYQKNCSRVPVWEGRNKLLQVEWARIGVRRQKIPAFWEKCGSGENSEGVSSMEPPDNGKFIRGAAV